MKNIKKLDIENKLINFLKNILFEIYIILQLLILNLSIKILSIVM